MLLQSRTEGDTVSVSEVYPLIYRPEHTSWQLNYGRMAYQQAAQRAAYAYRLFPALQLIDVTDGRVQTLTVPRTAEAPLIASGADVWDENVTHLRDLTSTDHYLYALYWGRKPEAMQREAAAGRASSRILKYDWQGQLLADFTIERCILCIGASPDDAFLLGYDGTAFLLLPTE